MAVQYYTLPQLKELALDSAGAIGMSTPYTLDDVDRAYGYAVSRCGYENPTSSDTDYATRQYWLSESMNLYFLYDVQRKHLLKFDVGDLKLSQISRFVKEMISERETSFASARSDPNSAHLFVSATAFFGTMVHESGIVDDLTGNSVPADEVE